MTSRRGADGLLSSVACSHDRVILAVIATVGAIPVGATLAVGASFGAAATIGLGMLVLSAGELVTARPDSRIPRARSLRGREVRSARSDDR